MESYLEFLDGLSWWLRLGAVAVTLLLVHAAVRLLRTVVEFLGVSSADHDLFARRYPRAATIVTMIVSALTFTAYFLAVGLLARELGLSLKQYVASATVIGLAVGFGSQGLVQDIVIGLTLIFSDVLNVGEMVDISGQTGRVEKIGLRFTTIKNLVEQTVHVPNRNIVQINRYRNGYIRAYVDVQIPEELSSEVVTERVTRIARGMRHQFPAIVLTEPDVMGVASAGRDAWSYVRVKFRIWPGQGPLIEGPFRSRVLAALKADVPNYADWMVNVTYRAE